MTSKAALFDFDGTFADTAPDLAAAVNTMRTKRGLEPLPAASVRPYASMGARGLLRIGFGMTSEHAEYSAMKDHPNASAARMFPNAAAANMQPARNVHVKVLAFMLH